MSNTYLREPNPDTFRGPSPLLRQLCAARRQQDGRLLRGEGLALQAVAKRQAGFSLTELVVALAVALILMAIGLPSFLRAYRMYQLSSAATQVAGILRLTRYEAIRLNRPVNCLAQTSTPSAGLTTVWVDTIVNNTLDPTEKMILLQTSGNLVSGGVPNTTALISAAVGSLGATPAPASGVVASFDARGAMIPPTQVTVFYLSSAVAPEAGFRAVLLMPTGALQVWTADTGGNWQQLR